MKRCGFMRTTALTGSGMLILPSGVLAGKNSPNNKLNIALIGVWERGLAHYDSIAKENVVALCDINEARSPEALQRFPKANDFLSRQYRGGWVLNG